MEAHADIHAQVISVFLHPVGSPLQKNLANDEKEVSLSLSSRVQIRVTQSESATETLRMTAHLIASTESESEFMRANKSNRV